MNDNTMTRRLAAWLPLACLAITTAAFGLGLPARIARAARHHAPITAQAPAADEMRSEPALFPMKAAALGAWGGFHNAAGLSLAIR